MSPADFKKFLEAPICSEDELFKLTEKQINDIANTSLHSRNYFIEQRNEYNRKNYVKKKPRQAL